MLDVNPSEALNAWITQVVTKELDAAEARIQQCHKDRYNSLSSELTSVKRGYDEKYNALSTELSNALAELNVAKSSNERLTGAIDDFSASAATMRSKMAEIETAISELQRFVGGESVTQLSSELNRVRDAVDTMLEQHNVAKVTVDRHQQFISDMVGVATSFTQASATLPVQDTPAPLTAKRLPSTMRPSPARPTSHPSEAMELDSLYDTTPRKQDVPSSTLGAPSSCTAFTHQPSDHYGFTEDHSDCPRSDKVLERVITTGSKRLASERRSGSDGEDGHGKVAPTSLKHRRGLSNLKNSPEPQKVVQRVESPESTLGTEISSDEIVVALQPVRPKSVHLPATAPAPSPASKKFFGEAEDPQGIARIVLQNVSQRPQAPARVHTKQDVYAEWHFRSEKVPSKQQLSTPAATQYQNNVENMAPPSPQVQPSLKPLDDTVPQASRRLTKETRKSGAGAATKGSAAGGRRSGRDAKKIFHGDVVDLSKNKPSKLGF